MFAAPGATNVPVEAEAERKVKSKRERQSRRSTQVNRNYYGHV